MWVPHLDELLYILQLFCHLLITLSTIAPVYYLDAHGKDLSIALCTFIDTTFGSNGRVVVYNVLLVVTLALLFYLTQALNQQHKKEIGRTIPRGN